MAAKKERGIKKAELGVVPNVFGRGNPTVGALLHGQPGQGGKTTRPKKTKGRPTGDPEKTEAYGTSRKEGTLRGDGGVAGGQKNLREGDLRLKTQPKREANPKKKKKSRVPNRRQGSPVRIKCTPLGLGFSLQEKGETSCMKGFEARGGAVGGHQTKGNKSTKQEKEDRIEKIWEERAHGHGTK